MPGAIEDEGAILHERGQHTFRTREVGERHPCHTGGGELPCRRAQYRRAENGTHLAHPPAKSWGKHLQHSSRPSETKHRTQKVEVKMRGRHWLAFRDEKVDGKSNCRSQRNRQQ